MNLKYVKIVSYLFHPLLIPVYSLLLYCTIGFMQMQDPKVLVTALLYTIFFSVLIPLIGLHWLHAKGAISSVDIPKQEDRVIPYLICASCMTICSIILAYKHMFPFIYGTMSAGAISIIICALINFWWKISIHTAAMGCWWGCVLQIWTIYPLRDLAHNNFLVISVVTLIFGLVASARIASRQHTQAQVYVGGFIGYLVGYGMLSFLSIR